MRLLLDTNILLDVLLNRTPWADSASDLIVTAERHGVALAVTTLSVANLYYIGRKHVGVIRAKQEVEACLDSFDLLSVDRRVLREASRLPGSDFEDNVQIAAAVQNKIPAIVTRDLNGFRQSPIPPFSPESIAHQIEIGLV